MSTRPRSILFFGINYAPEATGIAPYSASMCSGLAAGGNFVRVVTTHPHYPDWKINAGYGQWSRSEQIERVRVDRLRHYVPRRPRALMRVLSEISFAVRACVVRWGKPDVVVAVSPALFSSALVRLRARITHRSTPFIVWVQDLYGVGLAETGNRGLGSRLVALLEGKLLRSADAVVVIHERFAARVAADFSVAAPRLHVVRNWTHLPDLEAPDVAAVRARHGWAESDVVVVHAGNMGVKQGLSNVILAGRVARERSSRVRFVLVGGGSQLPYLQQMANEVPAAVEFVSQLGQADFTDLLQAADVLLVNELSGVSEMAVPSKLTSYFAAGRPVLVAADPAGTTAEEVRRAGAGMVVPAGVPSAIVEAAEEIARDGDRRRRYGAAGREYKESVLSETFAVGAFATLLSRLIDGDGAEQSDTHRTTID
jgi:colanic acid biosynthesis glycosyl transferase WcaI